MGSNDNASGCRVVGSEWRGHLDARVGLRPEHWLFRCAAFGLDGWHLFVFEYREMDAATVVAGQPGAPVILRQYGSHGPCGPALRERSMAAGRLSIMGVILSPAPGGAPTKRIPMLSLLLAVFACVALLYLVAD